MAKQISVRYGRNYQIVLGIVLPCLLIVPFIQIMQAYKNLEEWKVWTFIFLFLGLIVSLCLWIVLKAYPPAMLSISNQTITLSFNRWSLFSRTDFSFRIADITSFSRKEINGDEYVVFKIKHPARTFQISAHSYDWEDSLAFSNTIDEIAEMLETPA